MSYSEAIRFLYDLQLFGMKLGLENALRLAALAGNPQERLRFIHVAGTNGKGSTCAMLEGIYRAAGWRVGLFTSPHLVSFAERIQVDRRLIGQDDVARLVEAMRSLLQSGEFRGAPPTFFEVVTVMALQYFAGQGCDLVIWETGLGGRLDATNIVTPLASVITNIQLDHQKWLGETVAEIAREKAGIIKPGIPVITSTADPAALEVIARTARARQAPLTVVKAPDLEIGDFEIGLSGEHQRTNAALAVAVARVLRERLPVPDAAIRAGLKEVQWAGRLQKVARADGQLILLDGAHNPAGAQSLAAALPGMTPSGAGRRPALILGTMRDKDYAAICQILAPLAGKILLAPVGSHRTADPGLLAGYCRAANPRAAVVACENLAAAFAGAAGEKFVVVAGSIHFVGEAMEFLGLVPPSNEHALNDYHPSSAVPSSNLKSAPAILPADSCNPDQPCGAADKWVSVSGPLKYSGDACHRMEIADAKARIRTGFIVQSDSGNSVKFGSVLQNHFNRDKDTQRARFLASAEETAKHPVEVWQKDMRRYYIGRFRKLDGHFGFVVVTTRIGEASDEVITFFAKKGKELEKFRTGKLVWQK